jgi:hypothetical protein
MLDEARIPRSKIQVLWEALISLHISLAAVSVTFIVSFSVNAYFSRIESGLKALLHFRQTDLVYGHLATWIPSVLLAFVMWVVLRATARTSHGRRFLRWTAGIVSICIPAGVWISVYMTTSRPVGWPLAIAPFEILVVLVFTVRILSGKWRVPPWASLLLLAAHYAFWYIAPGSNHSTPGYAGLAGPTLGFCSSMVWGIYLIGLRTAEASEGSLVPR